MITVTKIEGDNTSQEVCTKLVELAHRRSKNARVGKKTTAKEQAKLEWALLYVFAMGDWTTDGEFYVAGTKTNCITPSMVHGILNETKKL